VLLLEEGSDLWRRFENLAGGSARTADERTRFLKAHDLTPRGLVELAVKDQRRVEDLPMFFFSKLHREGRSPRCIENCLKAIRSWLEFNGVKLVRKIRIRDQNSAPSTDDCNSTSTI